MSDRNHPDVEAWLPFVGRYALLTAEGERDLARRARDGCEEARAALVTANLRLVVMVARRFRGRGLDLADLVSEGNVGLIRAATGYDPERGCRFSTYAVWWIQQGIRRALQRCRPIRLPAHMVARTAAWRAASATLARTLERAPLPCEVAKRLALKSDAVPAVVQAIATAARQHLTLAAAPADEDERSEPCLTDGAPPPWATAHAALERERVAGLLAGLDERSRTVLQLRFGLGGGRAHTLVEVGELLHVTRERVRQLEVKALAALRGDARVKARAPADTIAAA
jgi:RNA polymerase primary sigma factor